MASLNRRRQAPLHLCTTKAQVLRLLAARGELELKDESTGRGSWVWWSSNHHGKLYIYSMV